MTRPKRYARIENVHLPLVFVCIGLRKYGVLKRSLCVAIAVVDLEIYRMNGRG